MPERKMSGWASIFKEEFGCRIFDPYGRTADSLTPKLLKEAEHLPEFNPYGLLQTLRAQFRNIPIEDVPVPEVPEYFTSVGDVNFTVIIDEVGICWITDQEIEDPSEFYGLVNVGTTRIAGSKITNMH